MLLARASLEAAVRRLICAPVRRQFPDRQSGWHSAGTGGGLDLARRAVDDLRADAIAIHLNPLQEAVQPEGERDWRHVLAAIEQAVVALPCRVIVEVGAGIGLAVARRLFDVIVWAVDVAGLGGTNWTRIEAARREDPSLFLPFLDWGTPTVTCLRESAQQCRRKRFWHLVGCDASCGQGDLAWRHGGVARRTGA